MLLRKLPKFIITRIDSSSVSMKQSIDREIDFSELGQGLFLFVGKSQKFCNILCGRLFLHTHYFSKQNYLTY